MSNLNCWELFDRVVGNTPRLLLYGKPGTGKTHSATLAALTPAQALRVQSVVLTEDTPAAEIRGHYIPQGIGKFVWHDGPGIVCWRPATVGRLVIDELDRTAGDVHSFLLKLLDDLSVARLTLPSGETIEPHPDFQCIATMNGELEDLPAALRDRFPVSIEIDQPHPMAVASLPKDLQKLARSSAMISDETRRVSVRVWKEFAQLRDKIGVLYAAQACFGQRADELTDALKIAS